MSTAQSSIKSQHQASGENSSPTSQLRTWRQSLEPIPNWCKLSRNDEVAIYRGEQKLTSGRVDMLATDGTVFWIIQGGGNGRTMIYIGDGLTVYRITSGSVESPVAAVHYKA